MTAVAAGGAAAPITPRSACPGVPEAGAIAVIAAIATVQDWR